MPALESELRQKLEKVIIQARNVVEAAARSALKKRAVDVAEPFEYFGVKEKDLRNRLRARGRQAGDVRKADKTQAIDHLAAELAYEFWHRMLFARFLAENHLLMHPDRVAVSLEECEALAKDADPPAANGFVLAARYASTMLPQIFRTDDVLLEIEFAPEQRLALEKLLTSLPQKTFLADDSLGWVYQFWQTAEKKRVNESGTKIGAGELSAVTQLFTEDYMVDFLLDNTLGAWWAGKRLAANPKLAASAQSEDELRKAVALPGVEWKYLRFNKDESGAWHPAAGAFDGWPKAARDLTCIDPCMGSGHFVVAMFQRLVAMRVAEEQLTEQAAVESVVQKNLFGLELDPRCTQIAAFNLALAAWRKVGYCKLPPMNLACSGMSPNATLDEWQGLAQRVSSKQRRHVPEELIKNGLKNLYDLFKDAPTLGSLINPNRLQSDVIAADFESLHPYLVDVFTLESTDIDKHERAVAAHGMVKAAEIMADGYTLVATNVPYCGFKKQDETSQEFSVEYAPDAIHNLATVFIQRCLDYTSKKCTIAVVSPQNWMFLGSYKEFRTRLLEDLTWKCIGKLGSGAFITPMWDMNVMLAILNKSQPDPNDLISSVDVSAQDSPNEKEVTLRNAAMYVANQSTQLLNPDCRVVFAAVSSEDLITPLAISMRGIVAGDIDLWIRSFWEIPLLGSNWRLLQSTVGQTCNYGGMHSIIDWRTKGSGMLRPGTKNKAYGRRGLAISRMGDIKVSIYMGDLYDQNVATIVPNDVSHLPALFAFCQSSDYSEELRKIDQKLNITNATLLKVPFNLVHWQDVAAEKYPDGLPKPHSNDPTQWLFNGYPVGSDDPLQVAVARLLGYRWPRQTGSSFPDCPALEADGLEKFEDNDGIVCLSAARDEEPAADRVLELLTAAYSKAWKPAVLNDLLAGTGATSLDDWLRNQFFDQHFRLFHHRPFIWHIWDGRKDGFSALVNYHRLTYKALENLTYAYLGDWITAQSKSDKVGADLRLAAAQALREKLKLILAGEAPYDIFVRWKPLHEQAIGWHPDLNDGVRMNIRPFIQADILRRTPNIKWTKDRGTEPERDKADYPWFHKDGKFVGDRVNDVHLTSPQKQAARTRKGTK